MEKLGKVKKGTSMPVQNKAEWLELQDQNMKMEENCAYAALNPRMNIKEFTPIYDSID